MSENPYEVRTEDPEPRGSHAFREAMEVLAWCTGMGFLGMWLHSAVFWALVDQGPFGVTILDREALRDGLGVFGFLFGLAWLAAPAHGRASIGLWLIVAVGYAMSLTLSAVVATPGVFWLMSVQLLAHGIVTAILYPRLRSRFRRHLKPPSESPG